MSFRLFKETTPRTLAKRQRAEDAVGQSPLWSLYERGFCRSGTLHLMDKDYQIVATFMEGNIIGIVEEHVEDSEFRVRLGEFHNLMGFLNPTDADQLSRVLEQLIPFLTKRGKEIGPYWLRRGLRGRSKKE